jgi:hypothetical protein
MKVRPDLDARLADIGTRLKGAEALTCWTKVQLLVLFQRAMFPQ